MDGSANVNADESPDVGLDDSLHSILEFFVEKWDLLDDDTRTEILRMLDDVDAPTAPVLSYIDNPELRRELFSEWQKSSSQLRPDASALAFFMVAPIDKIKPLRPRILDAVADLNTATYDSKAANRLNAEIMIGARLVVGCYTGDRQCEYPTIKASKDALARDNHRCIFSGVSDPTGARILPFIPDQQLNRDTVLLESLLLTFWGDEKAAEWMKSLREKGETAQNRLSLHRQLHHDLVAQAAWALKPISRDEKSVTVQWHWLKQSQLRPFTLIDDIAAAMTVAGLDEPGWGHRLAHRASGLPIKTGQTFVIKADNPEDLPSFSLLEMHWNLFRVAAICGAGKGDH